MLKQFRIHRLTHWNHPTVIIKMSWKLRFDFQYGPRSDGPGSETDIIAGVFIVIPLPIVFPVKSATEIRGSIFHY
jgi:hypothetical protein